MSAKLNIVIGSLNPVKINASETTFKRAFSDTLITVQAVDAPSGVSDQPMSDGETLLGARNRVQSAQQLYPNADFYVAFEGGVDEFAYGIATFAYVVIAGKSATSVGRTANLPLPRRFFQALQQGEELGDVLDAHFQTTNIKQRGGAIGLLTNQHESRQSTYEQALMLALAPFLHGALF